MVIFGTRPEAIKVAPVILALDHSRGFQAIPVVTAQHRSMLDQVLDLFGIRPHHDLDLMQDRQTLAGITCKALGGLAPLVDSERPDAIVVQGDTTTTFAGALAAFYSQIPVFHMEAGLRTNDPYSPYPEEINRRLTTQLGTVHLAPTQTSKQNLLRENVDEKRIIVTGNTVIDALHLTVARSRAYEDPALEMLDDDLRRVLLVTAHRRESWGKPMRDIGAAVAEIARREPELLVVFPIHKNPAVRDAVMPQVGGLDNVMVIEPLGYSSFARLMNRAHVVLSDSGGVQEEAPSLGKPVLCMRETTERPEGVAAGTVKLVGTDPGTIVAEVETLLHDGDAYRAMATAVNPYGDGHAARRTVESLAHFLDGAAAPEEFGEAGDDLVAEHPAA